MAPNVGQIITRIKICSNIKMLLLQFSEWTDHDKGENPDIDGKLINLMCKDMKFVKIGLVLTSRLCKQTPAIFHNVY